MSLLNLLNSRDFCAAQFPNLFYSCENCGAQITEGHLCSNCVTRIKSQFELHERQEKEKEDKLKEESIYFTMNKKDR